MKKVLSLLLVCVFLLMSLVACGGGKEQETQATEAPTGTETDEYGQEKFQSAVPEGLDFEGTELILYTTDGYNSIREWQKVEGYDTEIDLAVQTRNEKVTAEMNLTIRVEAEKSPGDWDQWNTNIHQNIMSDIQTGHFYDMYTMDAMTNYLDVRGCQANLLDEETFLHFDFTMPCWTQSLVDFQVNGKMYYISGDLNITNLERTYVTWHNKTLYDNVKNDEDPEDMQDYTLEGGFSYDVLYRWSELVTDGNTGKKHDNIYGIGDLDAYFFDAVPYAWDFNWIIKNADGTYSFNIIDNAKANNATEDLRLLGNAKGTNSCKGGYLSNDCTAKESQAKHFAAGKILFMFNTLYVGEEDNMLIRDMDDQYCVLPLPKYYETQKDYYTTVPSARMTSVLNQPEDVIKGEEISAFYQRATEISYTDIRAMYIESIIKPRFFGSDDDDGTVSKSIETFDKIYSSVKFDLFTVYGPQIEKINWLFRDMIEKNDRSLEDNFKENNNTWGTTITQADYEAALKGWHDYMWATEETGG